MRMLPIRRPPTRPRAGLVALALGLLAGAAAQARGPTPVDSGTYRVYQNDRFLGTEEFVIETRHDSLVVHSVLRQFLPRPKSTQDTVSKEATLILAATDGNLRDYTSQEYVNGRGMSRGLAMAETSYTSYRQTDQGGYGDTFIRPPGRIYIVDPQVFVLFEVISRDMHRQTFDERPITLLYLAGRDTAVEARVRRLGSEALHVGTRTIHAEKFSITDPWSQFYSWVSPAGRMLKLTLPAMGLKVERDPATLKPSGAAPTPAR